MAGSWDQVLAPVVNGKTIGVVDVAMDPTNPDVLYAATFDKVRVPWSYDLGGPGSRVYKTTDGGDNWEMLTNGLPQGMLGRIGIDIYLRDPNIVYLTIENANKEGMSDEERYQELLSHKSSQGMIDGEIYRSDDAGASWRKVSPDDRSIGGGPAYYYGQIIVDPNDPDVVHVLSAGSYGTRDGGQTWDNRPLGFGGDDHALWIDPENSDHMLLGYDHGLGVTWDGGENWYHPDNLSLAQFYAVGYDMSYPYRVAGGLQDNGSHMGPSTKPSGRPIRFEDWSSVGGGDGMYNDFETCTNRYLFNECQFGPLSRLDLWTGERKSIRYSRSRPPLQLERSHSGLAPRLQRGLPRGQQAPPVSQHGGELGGHQRRPDQGRSGHPHQRQGWGREHPVRHHQHHRRVHPPGRPHLGGDRRRQRPGHPGRWAELDAGQRQYPRTTRSTG